MMMMLTIHVSSEEVHAACEDTVQTECSGSVALSKSQPSNAECTEKFSVRYLGLTWWVCAKCPDGDDHHIDENVCPFYKCGDLPLCSTMMIPVVGSEMSLTPKQLKCMRNVKSPQKCGVI